MTLGDIIVFFETILLSIYELFRSIVVTYGIIVIAVLCTLAVLYPFALLFKLLINSVDTLMD